MFSTSNLWRSELREMLIFESWKSRNLMRKTVDFVKKKLLSRKKKKSFRRKNPIFENKKVDFGQKTERFRWLLSCLWTIFALRTSVKLSFLLFARNRLVGFRCGMNFFKISRRKKFSAAIRICVSRETMPILRRPIVDFEEKTGKQAILRREKSIFSRKKVDFEKVDSEEEKSKVYTGKLRDSLNHTAFLNNFGPESYAGIFVYCIHTKSSFGCCGTDFPNLMMENILRRSEFVHIL